MEQSSNFMHNHFSSNFYILSVIEVSDFINFQLSKTAVILLPIIYDPVLSSISLSRFCSLTDRSIYKTKLLSIIFYESSC